MSIKNLDGGYFYELDPCYLMYFESVVYEFLEDNVRISQSEDNLLDKIFDVYKSSM